MNCVICVEDAPLAASLEAAVQAFADSRRCDPNEVARIATPGALLVVDDKYLASVKAPPPGALAVAISAGSVNESVEILARHGWLSQLGTPAVFQGNDVAWMLFRVTQKLDIDTLSFLSSSRIGARRVLFYRSSDIEHRLRRLEEFAESEGARPRAIEQLHDITNELLVNALYDAPYEAGFLSEPPARQAAIVLPPDMPCELVYGAVENEIFVRVRDCFGALKRERLIEVLLRCARGASSVELDESRGGAGLGMWRIFRQSSRVVVAVSPGNSTEMLITVPKSGIAKKNNRAWHFFFEPASESKAQ